MSLGRANAGALVGGVRMPESPHWHLQTPHTSWGTQETVDYLVRAIETVFEQYPDSHALFIGDLSKEHGGPIRPHRSHRSGRDVDLSYFYKPGKAQWYRRAGAKTLDVERSWALVRALVVETDVEYIFINRSIQKLIKEHALAIGEDPEWLDRLFQYRTHDPSPIIRHAYGHDTHMHVRFYNPRAQALGVRAYPHLVEQKVITKSYSISYKAKKGDTIESIARRFATSVAKLRRLNGTRAKTIRAGRVYTVPTRGRVAPVRKPVVPQRRLPNVSEGSMVARKVAAQSR